MPTMHNVSSSYFDAASLTVALMLTASFLYLLACLGAWTSRRGLAWRAWSGMEVVVWPAFDLHAKQLQLASSGNQFSKIWPQLNL